MENQIDWRIVVAILFQESSLQSDPQNCLKNKNNCTGDYGIGQINYKVWNPVYNLDKQQLMTNDLYTLRYVFNILSTIRYKYSKERHWYTRYHSKTPHLREKYTKALKSHMKKINKHLHTRDM